MYPDVRFVDNMAKKNTQRHLLRKVLFWLSIEPCNSLIIDYRLLACLGFSQPEFGVFLLFGYNTTARSGPILKAPNIQEYICF